MGLKELIANNGKIEFTLSDDEATNKRRCEINYENVTPKDMILTAEALITVLAENIGVDFEDIITMLSISKGQHGELH